MQSIRGSLVLISAAVRDIAVEILFRDLEYLLDKYMTDMRKVRMCVCLFCVCLYVLFVCVFCNYLWRWWCAWCTVSNVDVVTSNRASAGCIGMTNWTHTRANLRVVSPRVYLYITTL